MESFKPFYQAQNGIHWFQFLKCHLFQMIVHRFGFCAAVQTKQGIKRLWELLMDIFHYFLTFTD